MGHLDSQRSLPVIKSEQGGPQDGAFSPTAKKLRLAPEHQVAVLNAPEGYAGRLLPGPRDIQTTLQPAELYDAVQLFVNGVEELSQFGPDAIRAVKPGGLLWITYPKDGAPKGVTDLPATPLWMRRDVLGEITSVTGYKPVAFVAVDDHWTAMRFKRV